jgi:hypothetical protein
LSNLKNLCVIEVPEMKLLLIAFACLVAALPAFAQQTCVLPQKTVIFFGNGIDTKPGEARESLKLLRNELGDTYNGQSLEYDVAYNSTYGQKLDLVQSALQAGVQFDSEIAAWLGDIGLAPTWFVDWYQKFLTVIPVVLAADVNTHILKYSKAIDQGKKVLVVSHSQGNFYVNEARRLMALLLTPAQMQNFAILGVGSACRQCGWQSWALLHQSSRHHLSSRPRLITGELDPS